MPNTSRLFWVYGAAVITLTAGCDSNKASVSGDPPTTAPQVATPAEETPFERITKVTSVHEAILFALPAMTDATNATSPGAVLFGAWASKNMTWTDVSVARSETSFGKVQKDADEERGKRLCVAGSIVQIKVSKTPLGKFSEGLFISQGGNLFNFANVGSSGDLVGRSGARMCGVVIGTYQYSNSAGGTGHAVQTVGMFDLPENHPPA